MITYKRLPYYKKKGKGEKQAEKKGGREVRREENTGKTLGRDLN